MLDALLARVRRTPLLSAWVPWEDYLDPRVALLSDGSAFAMFSVRGRVAETADAGTLDAWALNLSNVIRNVGTGRLVLHSWLCRGRADPTSLPGTGPYSVPWVEDLRHAYRASLDGQLYANRLFLGVQVRPAAPAGEWIGDRLAATAQAAAGPAAEDGLADRQAMAERICGILEEEMRDYGLRRLGLVERGNAVFCQMQEAVALAATGVPRHVGLTTGRPGDTLFSEDVTFHYETAEIRGPGWTTHAAHLGLREYPAVTWAGMYDALLSAPVRLTLAQSFRCMEMSEGQDVIGRKQNRMVWASDKAFKQLAGLKVAASKLQDGEFVMGDHSLTVCVFADREGGGVPFYHRLFDELRRAGLPGLAVDAVQQVLDRVAGAPTSSPLAAAVNDVWRRLGSTVCTVARENKGLMAAWLSMIPGNHRYRVRPGAISSRNFACMSAFHGHPEGAERSRWGAPIAVIRNTAGAPYRFHWHDGDGNAAVGNTFVSGQMGSGKSASVGWLIANTMAQGHGVVALDNKRGWQALAHATGSNYGVLGDGVPLWAPLKGLPNTTRSVEFMTDLLRGCIMQGGWRDLTSEEDRRLPLGVRIVMDGPAHQRSIAEVAAFLGTDPEGAGARLRKWCWGQELGWVLDAPEHRLDLAGDRNFFDVTRLLEHERARGPALLVLFHFISLRLDGRPLLVPIDEGWRALKDPTFRPFLEREGRTIRSRNGALVFISQSPADVVESGLASSLVEQCPNQMHFSNPNAPRRHYVEGLHLTEGEAGAVLALEKGSGRFLLRKGVESGVLQVPLAALEDELAILSTNEDSLHAIDLIPEAVRQDPAAFVAEFHRLRKIPRAVRHLHAERKELVA